MDGVIVGEVGFTDGRTVGEVGVTDGRTEGIVGGMVNGEVVGDLEGFGSVLADCRPN
jgi:hypothetical protein